MNALIPVNLLTKIYVQADSPSVSTFILFTGLH